MVKEFSQDNEQSFVNERNVMNALRAETGLIQYIGSLALEDRSYIVLEPGDQDLETHFRTQQEPISSNDIMMFWKGMLGISQALASIHNITIDGVQFAA